MKIYRAKKGFTLIEVMVSISVIILVVFAATDLLISIIRSNASNMNTLVAYGLAQEGLEGIRNIRDSDWLLNGAFNGTVGRWGATPWGTSFQLTPGDSQYFTIDSQVPDTLQVTSALQLQTVAPWKLVPLDKEKDYGASEATRLYKAVAGTLKEVHYTHAPSRNATPFHRYVVVTPEVHFISAYNPLKGFKKMRVSSIVEWEEYGRRRQVRLDTELTDWKEGVL